MTFDEWIVEHSDSIVKAREVSVQDISTDPGGLSRQLQETRKFFVAMGELKADATSWVNKSYAIAVQTARTKYGDYTADERKAMADSDETFLRAEKIKSDISTTMRALDKMHFEILNDRRSSFSPRAQAGA